jgi:RHS repeat-associated protein
MTWREQHLYGSSRLGIWRIDTIPTAVDLWKISNYANRRQYGLSNHLGNVMGVIGDHLVVESDTVRYPFVFSLNDYYVFGATKRWSGSEGYCYGFNGKENDNKVKGEGNQQDYGMRIYDPRLGRFLSVDPISSDYPWYSPYQFAGNKPIMAIDLDGLEEALIINAQAKMDYKPVIDAPNVITGFSNAAHNAITLFWNSTIGGAVDGLTGTWNLGVNFSYGKYKDFNLGNYIINSFNKENEYWFHTPKKQLAEDFLDAATDLRNYEMLPMGGLTAKLLPKAWPSRIVVPKIPQGLTSEKFNTLSQKLISTVGNLSDDIFVHGSRASGMANPLSDIDIGIRVSSQKFDEIIKKSFGTPNKGSALERTMNHAISTGKIQAGEAG